MTLTTWFSLVAICCLGAMSPGPSLAVVLRHTISNGRAHGIATAVSHAAGVALWAEDSAGLVQALDLSLQVPDVPARVCAQAPDLGLKVLEAGQCLCMAPSRALSAT